jgi:citrate lyase subunit beta/citryl-CoA lyase
MMIDNELLEQITTAYQKRDLEKLQTFCSPTYREINTTQQYSSVLMLSCNKINHLMKIPTLQADCIMLNLEDGVSQADKPYALVLCAIFLSRLRTCKKKLVVRVNSLDTTGYDEIAYLNQYMPDAVRVPKIKTKEEVNRVLALLHDDIELHLSIETKEAWHNLQSLKTNKMVTALYLGILDLFADMKLSQSLIERTNPTVLYMLPHFLITCRAMGVKAVSFVYQQYEDLEGFRSWVALEKQIGYDAKGCISPKQVEIVNEIFGSDLAEIKKAQEIIRLFEEQSAKGVTGFSHPKYGFIDEPIYKGALAVVGKRV